MKKFFARAKAVLEDKFGEGYIDTADNDGEVDEKMMQKLKGAAIYGRMFGENDNQN